MLASIIIITRNRSSLLRRCLESVAAQDYSPLEIIVVDNGSTDDTPQMLASHFPRAVYLPQDHNLGIPVARNLGFARASGEVCFCIDDDAEFVHPDTVRRAVACFAKDERLGCLALRVIDQHARIVRKLIPRRDRRVIAQEGEGAMFSGTGFALRKAAFAETGGFWELLSPYFGEEPDLSFRLIGQGWRILHTPHLVVRHYESEMERPKGRRIYYGARNTPWIALRSLPWYSVVSLTVFAWGYFLLAAVREKQLRLFLKAVLVCIHHLPQVWRMRQPVDARTLSVLRRHSGLHFY